MTPRPANPWTRNRGPVEVKHPPEKYLRPALVHVFRDPKPMTWGRIVVKGGALRWNVDGNGFVWFVATGEWKRIERELHRHALHLGWVDSGSLCFVDKSRADPVFYGQAMDIVTRMQ